MFYSDGCASNKKRSVPPNHLSLPHRLERPSHVQAARAMGVRTLVIANLTEESQIFGFFQSQLPRPPPSMLSSSWQTIARLLPLAISGVETQRKALEAETSKGLGVGFSTLALSRHLNRLMCLRRANGPMWRFHL